MLGLLIAVGAFAIDMYIPGFAAIARDLQTDPGTVQLSMTSFFVALALGQIVYGPVSDATGRRLPIFAGLFLFIVACAAAAFAPTIGTLIVARFFQGLGAAATAVIPMAMIRDQHTGPEAARLLSLAMASLSVSPILAPVFGGILVQYTSWRLIFVVLIVICIAVWVLVARLLPETLPPERRVQLRPVGILFTYGRLLSTRRFAAPIMIAAGGNAVLFVFIAGSPFVFVTLHGVTPTQFGVLFALHAICLIGISQFNAPMLRRYGARRLIGGASMVALRGRPRIRGPGAGRAATALAAGAADPLHVHLPGPDPRTRLPDRDGAVRLGGRSRGGHRRRGGICLQLVHHLPDGHVRRRHRAADGDLPRRGGLLHPRLVRVFRPHATGRYLIAPCVIPAMNWRDSAT